MYGHSSNFSLYFFLIPATRMAPLFLFLDSTLSFLAPHCNLSTSTMKVSCRNLLRYASYKYTSTLSFFTVCISQKYHVLSYHKTSCSSPPRNWSLAIAFHVVSFHLPISPLSLSLSLRQSLAFALLLCKQHGWDMMFTTGSRASSGLHARVMGQQTTPKPSL